MSTPNSKQYHNSQIADLITYSELEKKSRTGCKCKSTAGFGAYSLFFFVYILLASSPKLTIPKIN